MAPRYCQFGTDLRSAATAARAAPRTWAVFLVSGTPHMPQCHPPWSLLTAVGPCPKGVGSAADGDFEALGYKEKSVAVYQEVRRRSP